MSTVSNDKSKESNTGAQNNESHDETTTIQPGVEGAAEKEVAETGEESVTQIDSTTSESSGADTENKDVDKESEQVPGQPDTVTKSPQDPEHADLHGIPDLESFARVYIPVSDDKGELLGDVPLELGIKTFVDHYFNVDPSTLTDPLKFLENLRGLNKPYFGAVDSCEAISSSTIAKYRIRQGAMSIIEKRIVKYQGIDWEVYFSQHYDSKRFRSVQLWMQIARVPKAINYAVFGIERLLQLVRAVKGYEPNAENPIGDFLRKYNLPVDLEHVDGPDDEFRVQVDAALSLEKIAKEAAVNRTELNIDPELIKRWIRKHKELDPSLIGKMITVAKKGLNPNDVINEAHMNDTALTTTLTSEKTVTGFPKLVSEIKSTVQYLRQHTELLERINKQHIQSLEEQITVLKALITIN
jgi:hypothetical protein